jgi:CO/xanthine dehydrogenase FAD-binding subunit
LKKIVEERDHVRIGAAVSMNRIIENRVIAKRYPLLVKACSVIGSTQIRNIATVGGNIVNSAPCADSVPPLLVYNARVRLLSKKGPKEILLSEFIDDAYKVNLQRKEILSEIILPRENGSFNSKYRKLGRRKGVSISRISVALLMRPQSSLIGEFRLAVGAVTPVAQRLFEIEDEFKGADFGLDTIKKIVNKTAANILQNNELRWSTSYKIPVLQNIIYQLLLEIRDEIEDKD